MVVEREYAVWKDMHDRDGYLISKVEFLPGKLERILNGDETDVPRCLKESLGRFDCGLIKTSCLRPWPRIGMR